MPGGYRLRLVYSRLLQAEHTQLQFIGPFGLFGE